MAPGVDAPHPMGSQRLTGTGTTHSLAVMPTAAFAGDPLAPVFTYADGPDDAALALLVSSPLASEAVGSRRASCSWCARSAPVVTVRC